MKVLALVGVIVAALYELAVQGLGLAWFWGGFSNCARIVGVLPLLAIVAGVIAVSLPKARARTGTIVITLVVMLLGVASGFAATSRSEIPCGAPVQIKYSWLFFILLGVLAAWSIWRVVREKEQGSEPRVPAA